MNGSQRLIEPAFTMPPVRMRYRTVAETSSIGGFTFVQGGLTLKIWWKLHWYIVLHITIWGDLVLCLGGLAHNSPPVATRLMRCAVLNVKSAGILHKHYFDNNLFTPNSLHVSDCCRKSCRHKQYPFKFLPHPSESFKAHCFFVASGTSLTVRSAR